MGEATRHRPGSFSWCDLGVPETQKALDFYTGLFGWTPQANPIGDGMSYYIFLTDDKDVAALYPARPDQHGAPTGWMNYISVDDLELRTKTAEQAGGTVLAEPFEVFDSGRMSTIQDPTGAVFSLWEAKSHIGARVVNEPGAMCWNELWTTDDERAKTFYRDVFGWTYEGYDMGDGAQYTVVRAGERSNGGIVPRVPEGTPPQWIPYFGGDVVDDAVIKAQGLGATVIMPAVTAGAGRFAALRDPEGAAFAVYEGPYDEPLN